MGSYIATIWVVTMHSLRTKYSKMNMLLRNFLLFSMFYSAAWHWSISSPPGDSVL